MPQKNKQNAASLELSQLHKPSNCRKGHLDDISAGWLIGGGGVDSVRAPESVACQLPEGHPGRASVQRLLISHFHKFSFKISYHTAI